MTGVLWSISSFSQLTVTSSPTPLQLVESLLAPGIVVSNVTTTGSADQRGMVSGGAGTQLGFPGGVILTSGLAGAIAGTGSGATGGVSGNADLLTIANSVPPLINQFFSVSSVNDISILEFDFVPQGDSISFRYVFGSDEYLAWVNSGYNDVFAFLLAGPGITGPYSAPAGFTGGSVNIATVPGSNPALPITISSVNNVLNSQYYIDQPQGVVINGMTTVFTAKHPVQCGEHITSN